MLYCCIGHRINIKVNHAIILFKTLLVLKNGNLMQLLMMHGNRLVSYSYLTSNKINESTKSME